MQPALFDDVECTPKEAKLIQLCMDEKALGRKVLVYSIYSGTRDTTARSQGVQGSCAARQRRCGQA